MECTVAKGKIGQAIDPGTFFFYAKVATTMPNQVVTVSQSNGTATGSGSGASFTVPVPGDYIIAIKYRTKSLAKTAARAPADITYSFTTSLGGSTGASLLLKRR